ncbi:hypothetical protein BD413DRAFT_462349 [Trametes elegans]|nr:hypothetical protein BD413DRAFT_462349 [Trametes elegans]
MAQLLAPAAPASERISQILPSVKCSTCNQPVSIADLGDHVCAPLPPVPALPGLKTPSSPRSVAALLPTRLQNLVSNPPAQSPPRKSSFAQQPLRQKSPAPSSPQSPPSGRARAPSAASSFSVSTTFSSSSYNSRSRDSRPYSRSTRTISNGSDVTSPSSAGPSVPPRIPSPRIPPPQSRTPDSSRTSIGTDRSPTPGRTNIAAPGTTALRPRTPSAASTRPGTLLASGARQPAQPAPTPYGASRPDPRAGPGAGGAMSPPSARQRSGTNASARPPFEQGPEIIYSTDARSRTPANDPSRIRAPSSASMRPSLDQQRPYMGNPPPPSRTPPSPVGTPRIEPNTQTGGEAGMAGVGRRGFAAAARAAMFTMGGAPMMPPLSPTGMSGGPSSPGGGMDGRRANAPRFLDIASATRYAATTPPLSPGSGTASLSPHSPYSQKSPVSAGLPSPSARVSPNMTPTTPAGPGIASSPTSPVSVHSLRDRVLPPSQEPPKAALPDPPSTPRLPFFEKFKNKLPAVDTVKPLPGSPDPSPLSPRSDDGSYDGLAYANSDDDDDEVDDLPLRASPLPLTTPGTAATAAAASTSAPGENKVRFPSMTNSESKYSSASSSTADSPHMPKRTLSASTASSSYTARTVAKSTGALDRAMETLFEDSPVSPTTSSGSGAGARPFAVDGVRDSVGGKSPKLPVRSHTSPTLPSSARPSEAARKAAGKAKRPRVRTCIRCERTIDDGRWIQMEGGNVLCDKCWKNMYLPKCRRCNKTIEKQAVSSSDGQLKGKYHKECFSCFTCEKPFPDKTFYVFDGKPLCAYHYHEENNSLCAAARCGQPIEGPCAVSHAGDRYHPEHLVCEYRGCTERLVEYYELDGRMLCERHVQRALDDGEDEDALGAAGDRTTVALKRVTRFIDIAALGPAVR